MKQNSAVTVLGLLLLVAVATLTLCGLLYLAKKTLSAGRRIQENREATLGTNSMDVEKNAPLEDLFFDTPGTTWTELTNGWWTVHIPDEEFAEALDANRLWAILYTPTLAGPWLDTGERHWGNPGAMAGLLRDWATYEARLIPGEAHANGNETGFYRYVLAEEVPVTANPN